MSTVYSHQAGPTSTTYPAPSPGSYPTQQPYPGGDFSAGQSAPVNLNYAAGYHAANATGGLPSVNYGYVAQQNGHQYAAGLTASDGNHAANSTGGLPPVNYGYAAQQNGHEYAASNGNHATNPTGGLPPVNYGNAAQDGHHPYPCGDLAIQDQTSIPNIPPPTYDNVYETKT